MEKKVIVKGLKAIKDYSEVELEVRGRESSGAEFFVSDIETVGKAISLIENIDLMKDMKKEDIDSLLSDLKEIEDYSRDELSGSEGLGIVGSEWENDVTVLEGARDFIKKQRHACFGWEFVSKRKMVFVMVLSDLFEVSNKDKVMVAHYNDQLREEVKKDAKLCVLSTKTNFASFWEYAGTSRLMKEGIDYDMFVPSERTVEMLPSLKGYMIKIFND